MEKISGAEYKRLALSKGEFKFIGYCKTLSQCEQVAELGSDYFSTNETVKVTATSKGMKWNNVHEFLESKKNNQYYRQENFLFHIYTYDDGEVFNCSIKLLS